jgi:hypothetical protein
MEDLVARAREADARLAEVREGAVPAGDPDPYREPPGAAGDDDLDDDDLDEGEPGAEDLDGDLDDDPDDDVLDDEYLDEEPESTASGTRPARDVLGGTSAAGDHGAGYSPA